MKELTQLFGLHPNGRGLFIGSGVSGAEVAGKPAEWFDANYDFVIVPNQGFEPYIDAAANTIKCRWYSFIIETSVVRFNWFYKIPPTFTRILHTKNMEWFHKVRARFESGKERDAAATFVGTAYGAGRNKYELRSFNPRPEGYSLGFISGDVDDINHAKGTVALQAMHFAALLGAAHLDIIGVELCFAEGVQHYFEPDEEPFLKSMRTFPSWFTAVKFKGEWCLTHKHFLNSASYIDQCYPCFTRAGMSITRCCDSLIERIPRGELPCD
jgi:hypothetical protein